MGAIQDEIEARYEELEWIDRKRTETAKWHKLLVKLNDVPARGTDIEFLINQARDYVKARLWEHS